MLRFPLPPLYRAGGPGRRALVGPTTTLLLVLAGCDAPVYVRTSGINGDAAADKYSGDGAANSGGGGGITVGGSGGSVVIATGGAGGSGGVTASGGSGGVTSTGGVGTGGAVVSTGGNIASTGGAASGGRGTGGAGAGTGGMATTGGMIGSGGAGTGGAGAGGAAVTDTAKYNFETSAQSWASLVTPAFMSVGRSTTRRYAGQAALAGAIAGNVAGIYQFGVAPTPAVPAGATLTFHIYFPAGSTIDWIQPYALAGSVWTGTYSPVGALTSAAWNTITVKVPTPSGTIGQIGVQFHVTGTWSGTVYVDSVNW